MIHLETLFLFIVIVVVVTVCEASFCLCPAVIERWELLQAQELSSDAGVQQDLQQWQKLNSDLCEVTSWLGRVLPELERLQRIAPSTSVRDIEVNIRKLKVREETQRLQLERRFNTR